MDARNSEVKLFWEQFHRSPLVKAVAVLLVVAVTWVFVGRDFFLGHALAELNYDSAPTKAKKPTKPAEKLHAAVQELQELLAVQATKDLTDKQVGQANAARKGVSAQLAAVESQFVVDRVKLWKLDAKDALKRLSAIEAKTAKLKKQLAASLASVPSDGAKATVAAASATKTLTALSPEKPQQPLSSDLSFGIKNAKPRSVSLSAGITPAYNSPTPNETASPLPREPQPEDLEETPETRVTPAIEQLATTLENDPVKIYEYVRNNIRFEAYYGIRKGADQTLAEKAGSDADQAALLIALLRQSGFHSRFVQGVVELPAEKAANWLGVNTAAGERLNAVPEILWSGGIPTNTTRVAGKLTKVRFNHIWAESYLPQAAYRGVDEGSGEKSWSPLDASIKPNLFTAPAVNFGALDESASDLVEKFVGESEVIRDSEDRGIAVRTPSVSTIEPEVTALIDAADQEFEASGLEEGDSAEQLYGGDAIAVDAVGYLPASLPTRVSVVSAENRSLSDYWSTVRISVDGEDPVSMPTSDGEEDLSFDATTIDMAGKRVTLAYVPATTQDGDVIDAYHGLLNAPSYAAALTPVLRVDGRIVARGHEAVSTGYVQKLTISYSAPGMGTELVENALSVGSLTAFTLGVGEASGPDYLTRLENMANSQASATSANVLTDARAGEMMSALGHLYFVRNDLRNRITAQLTGVHEQRQLSGAIVATGIDVSYVGDFPVLARLGGIYMDVDQDLQSVIAKTDSPLASAEYINRSGLDASNSESQVFETSFGQPAASTTRVFQKAVADRTPLYSITQENVNSAIPRLSVGQSVEDDITRAVSSGARVMVPETATSIGGWTGVGYAIYRDGAADYRITGGQSGSWLELLKDFVLYYVGLSEDGYSCSQLPGNLTSAVGLGGLALYNASYLSANVAQVVKGIAVAALSSVAPIIVALIALAAIFALVRSIRSAISCNEFGEEIF